MNNPKWPILRQYDQNHLDRIALPLGGIGSGTISLGGRGDLRHWVVGKVPAKGFNLVDDSQPDAFFGRWSRNHCGQTATRALEGAFPELDTKLVLSCAAETEVILIPVNATRVKRRDKSAVILTLVLGHNAGTFEVKISTKK